MRPKPGCGFPQNLFLDNFRVADNPGVIDGSNRNLNATLLQIEPL